jgi:DNA polymerase III delta prime subunit
MLKIEKILLASEQEIALANKDSKGIRLSNLIKEVDTYRCLSKFKIEGEYLLSSPGMEDQAVSIEFGEGVCFISGLDSQKEVIAYATLHKDETSLLRAVHAKLESLKAGDEVVKNPFFMVGPPGTGKTKTICAMVEELIAQDKKVLVVSPTNMAVENVFERLDYEKMGLVPGSALLSVRTDNEALLRFSPATVAQAKLQPISDELEMLEAAMSEILSAKRDADTAFAVLVAEEESIATAIANLSGDEAIATRSFAKATEETKAAQGRLDLLQGNVLVKTVAGAFLGKKVAEIEAEHIVAKASAEAAQVRLAQIKAKKEDLLSGVKTATENLQNAREKAEEASRVKGEVEKRIEELKKQKIDLLDLNLFEGAKLVGATLMAAALNKKINDGDFDVIIVDEASMASLPTLVCACKAVKMVEEPNKAIAEVSCEGLYPAQQDAVRAAMGSQFVFVGDPKQLSPIAKTQELRKSIFDVYGVERIFDGEPVENAVLLDTNFRNHPDITELASKLFYGGKLKSGREHTGKKALYIRKAEGKMVSSEGSYVNHPNAAVTIEQIASALSRGRRSIGVITPYRKQAENAEARLENLRTQYPDADMQAGTVHKFQGKEKGIVLFDLTASSGSPLPATYKGDMNSEAARLLNVAMTRAEDFFILVGDVDGLERQMKTIQGYESMALYQWIVGIKELAYSE